MKTFLIIIALFLAINALYLLLWPTDSTDISRWKRSGLSVYTDNATGVQYVKAGIFGNITPRRNADGSLYSVKQ